MKLNLTRMILSLSLLSIAVIGCPSGEESSGGGTVTPDPEPEDRNFTFTLPGVGEVKAIEVPAVSSGWPMGEEDRRVGPALAAFHMSDSEVSWKQWYAVYAWATTAPAVEAGEPAQPAPYSFANAGSGSGSLPVGMISWRDAVVWCNALTEYYNANNGGGADLSPVYRSISGGILRDSNDTAVDAAVKNGSGFRLPGDAEWELAARYQDGSSWTSGISASGAAVDFKHANGEAATAEVAWYMDNANVLKPIKGRKPNQLGLYDMSGSVWEWCFDTHGANRLYRGGSAFEVLDHQIIGHNDHTFPPTTTEAGIGFRIVK